MKKEVDILGEKYNIYYNSRDKDKTLDTKDGYTDNYTKRIVINTTFSEDWDKEDIKIYQKKVLRHEIVHAYLYESGLDVNSNRVYSWAENEEMVDWIAIQGPKLFKVYKELDIL